MGLRVGRSAVDHHGRIRPLLPAGHRPYPFAGGRIYLDLRESPMMLARALRVYEPAKVATLIRLLRPGMTFLDVGSNKGDFSLIAARHMGDTGRVLAIEPGPENCRWIRRSIERNGYRSVRVHQLALSDSNGTAVLHLGERSGWHTLVPGVRDPRLGALEVSTRTLDDLAASEDLARVDVMKIDVEGAEDRVLAGAERMLSGTQPMAILLDLHPPIVDPSAICAMLVERGFRLHAATGPTAPLSAVSGDLREVVALRGAW